jgi:2,3,4,5-tetrahydropyridine-2-carboxylate N-succinyltransferase
VPAAKDGPEIRSSAALRTASGVGLATVADRDGLVLDVWYLHIGLNDDGRQQLAPTAPAPNSLRRVHFESISTTINLDSAVESSPDAYLRLHLLSSRLVAPNTINLDGIFAQLATVAWTQEGAVHADDLDGIRSDFRLQGRHLCVHSIDKFPSMTDFISPPDIRIADAGRVRLGAHLAAGTVVMHEGFVNFNAGTLGTSMVEGRVTQGSIVEAGADIGAGSSIMGTLSGGGTNVSRVGRRALLGANAGIGISLGDDSAVEAGLYVTKGTLVTLPDGSVVKAAELSDQPGILFRRNSKSGVVEVIPWKSATFTGLNPVLH